MPGVTFFHVENVSIPVRLDQVVLVLFLNYPLTTLMCVDAYDSMTIARGMIRERMTDDCFVSGSIFLPGHNKPALRVVKLSDQ